MLGPDLFGAFEIGNGAADFQDSVMGPGSQTLLVHGALQEPFAVRGEFAELPDVAGSHLRVAISFGRLRRVETLELNFAGADHSLSNHGGVLRLTR